MATTTATMNVTTSKPYSSTSELRQHYQSATRAFLVRDYPATASSLHDAFALLPPARPEAWFAALQQGKPVPPEVDLRRRLEVLQVTFLATVRSGAVPSIAGGGDLAPLLELSPSKLIKSLWDDLLSSSGSPAPSASEEADILPTPSAAFLHPSLAVALSLAALKLESPRQAKQIAEAWFGSVDGEVEKMVWEASQSGGFSVVEEFPLDGVETSGGGMSGSSMLGRAGGKAPAGRSKADEAKKAVVGGWLKLLDLLVLHVLPQLGEWEAAGDFARLQGAENGGWVPDERVEAALRRLVDLQRGEAEAAAARIQRQKDLDAAKAEKKRSSRSPTSASSASAVKNGKGKARETSPATSNGSSSSSSGSPTKKGSKRSRSKTTSPIQGSSPQAYPPASEAGTFSGFRSSLSSYLSRPSPSTAQQSPPTRQSLFSTLLSLIRSRTHYDTDPLRLLSFAIFTFAFLTWARRRMSVRRAKGERGLGLGELLKLVGGKVGETVGMATRVTAM
ncbi:hypothetical protein JCM11251_006088 [Rhodosporidiobolus azoricus]